MRTALMTTAAALLLSSAVLAQKELCDLSISTFSYQKDKNSKLRQLTNLKLRLKGKGIEQSLEVSGSTPDRIFRGIPSGPYEVQVSKIGFSPRSKDLTLFCTNSDEGIVYHQIHIWPQTGYKSIDSDFLELTSVEKNGSSNNTGVESEKSDKTRTGTVVLNLVIDEDGNVVSASKLRGDDDLAKRAIKMAFQSKFAPTMKDGTPQRIEGSMTYNFVP